MVLQVAGERVDDPVDGALSTVGVQGAEDHVTGFRSTDCRFDGFQVTKLTDQDHVGVLPQRSTNRFAETWHVHADFTLVDRRFNVVVIKLDRVFDRDDVVVNGLVDQVDQRRQRCRFA